MTRRRQEDKLPVFPLYVSDFLGSGRVLQLDGVTAGVYLLALVHEWNRGGAGLPADEGELRRLLRLSARDWKRVRSGVLQFYRRRRRSILCPVLVRVMSEVRNAKSRRQDAAKSRWNQWDRRRLDKSKNAKHVHPYPDPDPSSSPPTPLRGESGGEMRKRDGPGNGTEEVRSVARVLREAFGFSARESVELAREQGYTAEDLEAWKRFLVAAESHAEKNPGALVRKVMAGCRHPDQAGYAWWTTAPQEAKRKASVLDEAAMVEESRRRFREQLGKVAEVSNNGGQHAG